MPIESFEVVIDYQPEELAAYQDIASKRDRRRIGHRKSDGMALYYTGVIVGLVAAVIAYVTGCVDRTGGAIVAVLSCGAFYMGIWRTNDWVRAQWRQTRKAYFDAYRASSALTSMLVTSRGIMMRRQGTRIYITPAAIDRVTLERGLIVFWSANIDQALMTCVPARLVDETQKSVLMTFAQNAKKAPREEAPSRPT